MGPNVASEKGAFVLTKMVQGAGGDHVHNTEITCREIELQGFKES